MKKKIEQARKQGFSLIELMIVIVIIGALTAIILPQFDGAESDAKDTGCDASNYGTLRQLTTYKAANGVYPSRLHTGYEADADSSSLIMGTSSGVQKLATPTGLNIAHCSTPVELSPAQAKSLKDAGIVKLAFGGYGTDIVFPEVAENVTVASITASWGEEHESNNSVTAGTEVTINGLEPYLYASAADPMELQAAIDAGTVDPDAALAGDYAADGIVVPLFIAPTADWEHAYNGSVADVSDSKIGMQQEGGCPWLDGDSQFRYYIAFFKVYNEVDGEVAPAKFLGTACPECGSLNP